MPTKYVPARGVLKFRDKAFVKYYTNPRYLEMVEKRFGPQTLAHIREMTTYRLERDLVSGRLDVPLTTLPAEGPAPAPNLVQIQVPPKAGERGRKTA